MSTRISYNLRQAAAETGVSPDTLKAAVAEGTLRAKRTGKGGGGLYLFTHAALEAWLEGLGDA